MTSQTIHDVLVINQEQDQPRILVTEDLQIPTFETDFHFWQSCEFVNQAIGKAFNIKVFTIRCLRADFGDDRRHYRYSMVYHSGVVKSGKWVAITDLEGKAKTLAQEAISSRANQPEWYALDGYKAILDAFPDAIVEQVRSWERSAVWRIRHGDRIDYLKLMPKMFYYEGSLNQYLATHFSDLIPMPELAMANAMLTPEYRGTMLDHSLSNMATMLSAYAEMQVQTVGKLDDLRALGVGLRDKDWLQESLDRLMVDDDALHLGTNPLKAEEIQQIHRVYPLLKPYIEDLGNLIALEHGDLHHGQIFVDDALQFTFSDFSDATISHPFFSLEFFLWDVEDQLHAPLTSAYLAPFKQVLDEASCLSMIASTKLLSPLFSALRYYADILPQMAYPWEMNNMLSFNLRTFLKNAQKLELV